MTEKKVRGLKRKSNIMVKRIKEHTLEFPTEFDHGYWHLHLPVAQNFISSSKTPNRTKRLCIQTLLNRAVHLIEIKPQDKEKYRVVAAVELPHLWDSQLIVFKGDSYFKDFFNRDNEHQKWFKLAQDKDIQKEWGLSIQQNLNVSGFKKILIDEDGAFYESDIWFIGELV